MQTASRYPWGKGTPIWVLNNVANDSDKTAITVPGGKIYDLKFLEAVIDCTVAAGVRALTVIVTNGVATLSVLAAEAVAASARGRIRLVNTGLATTSASANAPLVPDYAAGLTDTVSFFGSLPDPCLLLPGYTVRIYDQAAIAAAADDLVVALHYIEYDE